LNIQIYNACGGFSSVLFPAFVPHTQMAFLGGHLCVLGDFQIRIGKKKKEL